jgi:hypothetical protein
MNCINSFVSDGVYFYHAQNGQKCYKHPIEACQNPQIVLTMNGNPLLGYCNSIRTGGLRDDDSSNIYSIKISPDNIDSIENFEMRKSSSYIVLIILFLIIIGGAIIYLK